MRYTNRRILYFTSGSAHPRHDDQDQSPRARHVLFLPARRDGHLQLGGVLRRGRRARQQDQVDPGRVLVGHRHHDDGRVRRRTSGRRLGQAGRHAVRHRRRSHHCTSGPGRRRQLQQLLPPREWAWLRQLVTLPSRD